MPGRSWRRLGSIRTVTGCENISWKGWTGFFSIGTTGERPSTSLCSHCRCIVAVTWGMLSRLRRTASAALLPAWNHSKTYFYISCFPNKRTSKSIRWMYDDRWPWSDPKERGNNKTKILGGWVLSVWVLVFWYRVLCGSNGPRFRL